MVDARAAAGASPLKRRHNRTVTGRAVTTSEGDLLR
jgi:hypothetical protein